MMIGCIQTYMVKQRKIDYDTYEEGKDNEGCVNIFFGSVEDEKLNSIYSMEEFNRFFSTSESKVLRHLFMKDFMTKNIFFKWLHDLKEFVRCQTSNKHGDTY